jgi:Pyridoxamine 5'-phosphate oxidase
MIPGKILRFLEDQGTIAVSGTRDANLIPHVHPVSGWEVEPDKGTIRCSINQAYLDNLISSLQDNGQFSLTVEQIGSHETYQFKGNYVGSTQPASTDLAAHQRMTNRFAKAVNQLFGVPEDSCRAYIPRPSLVVRFTVQEIFLQTPGPGAGHRVCPPEEPLSNAEPAGHGARLGSARPHLTDERTLPDEIKSVMENGLPAIVVTCSADGIPNATIISHVHYVDKTHAALSFQFFNKTIRNVRENSYACVALNDVMANAKWILDVQYEHSETEGPIFDEMDMQIEAIASASGMAGIFKLRAADIYFVRSFRKLDRTLESSVE